MKRSTIGVLLLFFLSLAQAQNFWKGSITGEGPVVKQEKNLSSFTSIKCGFNAVIYLSQGEQKPIRLEGQQNILDNLKLEVNDQSLAIKYDQMIKKAEPVIIYITIPTIRELTLSGSGTMKTTQHFSGLQDIKLGVSGSGDMRLDLDADQLLAQVSGSGDISLVGSGDALNIKISGSGEVKAMNFGVSESMVEISGSGNAHVRSRDSLDAKVSGSGNVYYYGEVNKLTSRISGSGKTRQASGS